MNSKVYAKVVGIVLLLVGAVGFLQKDLMGMDLSKRHNAVHLLTGGILVALGFGSNESLTKNVVMIFGAVYAILGVWGFFTPMILENMRIFHTDIVTNCIHLVVGLLGLAAAMMGGAKAPAAAAS